MSCTICGATQLIRLSYRKKVPIFQNLVWPSCDTAKNAPSGMLDMVQCTNCGFAWNKAFDSSLINYSSSYDNDQSRSDTFAKHMSDMADRVVAGIRLSSTMVEVGCGQDGLFLRLLADRLPALRLYGFDPSWRGRDLPPSATVFNCYFDAESVRLLPEAPAFIVSRHTIEHIEDPLLFLSLMRNLMTASQSSRLFLETPDIDWIVSNRQPQDLFYEHCSIFSDISFALALAKARFEPVSIDRVFGGQYFWVEARPVQRSPTILPQQRVAVDFESDVDRIISRWRQFVAERAQLGRVYIWGAASKGVTFSLLLGDAVSRIEAAVDINPKKVGQFLPLTGLPIIGGESVIQRSTIIVMNPNYSSEIAVKVQGLGVELFNLGEGGAILPA